MKIVRVETTKVEEARIKLEDAAIEAVEAGMDPANIIESVRYAIDKAE